MNRGDTKIHPLSPLHRKTHPLKNSHKKAPRHTIICLFNIKLANETRKIGFKRRSLQKPSGGKQENTFVPRGLRKNSFDLIMM